jgi:hypothetical protein
MNIPRINKLSPERQQEMWANIIKAAKERNPQLFKELTEEQKKMIEELKARK